MTFDQLEAVEAIVNTGSFLAAGKSLRRTQPAISSSIKKLEESLGIEIFS